jgi:tetratricopeptide (TPR) repeat protein
MDLVVAVAFVVIATRFHLQPSQSFDPWLLLLFFPLIVLVHEAGHAVAALLVGHRVLEVKIGAGPNVTAWHGRWRLVLGLFPLGGHVMAGSSDPSGYRSKRFAITAAGPAMNALMFAFAPLIDASSSTLRDFAIVNACVLIFNLFPYSVRTPYGRQRTDGLGLVRTVSDSEWQLAEERSGFAVARAALADQHGDPEEARRITDEAEAMNPRSVVLRTWMGYRAIKDRGYAAARTIFRELVDEDRQVSAAGLGQRDDVSRGIHLNNLAWCDLMLDDPGLVEEALSSSAAAIELLPKHPAIQGTRAFALILGGRPGEGIELAHAAYAKTKEAGPRALQACVLAIGYARDWRFAQAARWIDVARGADPNCSLLGRSSGELEALRPHGDGAVAESG